MPGQQQGNSHADQFAGSEPSFFRLADFKGLNTRAKRPAIEDQQLSWLENIMPIGAGNARAMQTNGATIYTATGGLTIIYLFFFNIVAATYAAVFLSDGTAVQVNLSTLATTPITSIGGTFFPGSSALGNPAPACAQWGSSGIIIVTTASVNGYYAWDGTTLYSPGSLAPNWLTNSTPTVMATGISGTAVETYQSRSWVMNGNIFSVSAPGNGADFSSPDGGVAATPSSDSFLRREFTQAKQNGGFIYLIADSSINVISNVQSSGLPLVTSFNNQNVSANTGTPWHNSVQQYGDGLVFGNISGVYELRGGTVHKISDELDGLFAGATPFLLADATTLQPSSAVATIYGIRVYMLLLTVLDLFTQQPRNVLAMWDGKKWFLGSQDLNLTFVASQEINSQLTAWGTDGTHLFQLFGATSTTLNKIIQSKLWPGDTLETVKQIMRAYILAQDNSGAGFTISGTVDFINENTSSQVAITYTSVLSSLIFQNSSFGNIQFQNASSQNIYFSVVGITLAGSNEDLLGALVGLTLTSTSQDFTVQSLSLLYRVLAPIGG
jgi:hypothetical protein